MGNSIATDKISERYPLRVSELENERPLKTSIGSVQIVREPKSDRQYILMPIYFDSDEVLKTLIKALDDISNSKQQGVDGYVQVEAAEVSDKRLMCSTSSFVVALDYFKLSLDDAIRTNNVDFLFETESRVWNFIFTMISVIRFNTKNKIQGNFFHAKSICWLENSQSWGLVHPALFPDTNNYVEALAGKMHFCSPELFSQVATGSKHFYINDQDRSDMFSVGLITLCFLSKGGPNFIMDSIYNRNQNTVDGLYLQRVVNSLERHNFSDLLIRVIGDMVQELEHLRMSSSKFFESLEKHKENLVNQNFKSHEKLLDEYMELKSSQIAMSLNNEFIEKEDSDKYIKKSTVLGRRRGSIDPSRKAVPYSREERPRYI
jgi:hypothetical protein